VKQIGKINEVSYEENVPCKGHLVVISRYLNNPLSFSKVLLGLFRVWLEGDGPTSIILNSFNFLRYR